MNLARGWVTKLAVGEIREAQTSQNNLYHVGETCSNVPIDAAFSYLLNSIFKFKTTF